MKFDLEKYLRVRSRAVDVFLRRAMAPAAGWPPELRRAMLYSIFPGGKRLRPILLLAAAELVRGDWRPFLPAAGAVEMLHTYSLIHDDLPAMDDDDLRRGRPTCHKIFGEATAILAGDAFNTLAFHQLAILNGQRGLPPMVVLRAAGELADAAGVCGMVGGQVLDLAAEGKRLSLAQLQRMHAKKTGALIRAALRMGAILAGGGREDIAGLDLYGRDIGLAFQIIDDVLGSVGDSGKMGKNVGSDQRQHKYTFVSHYGAAEARRLAGELVAAAKRRIVFCGRRAQPLQALADYVLERER